jgi:hypothetical protein
LELKVKHKVMYNQISHCFFQKNIQLRTYGLCSRMDAMSTRQILVIKKYDKMNYRHEKIITLIQMNMIITISLKK